MKFDKFVDFFKNHKKGVIILILIILIVIIGIVAFNYINENTAPDDGKTYIVMCGNNLNVTVKQTTFTEDYDLDKMNDTQYTHEFYTNESDQSNYRFFHVNGVEKVPIINGMKEVSIYSSNSEPTDGSFKIIKGNTILDHVEHSAGNYGFGGEFDVDKGIFVTSY